MNSGGAQSSPPPFAARVALSVFLPFAAAYFLSYAYRSINAVIAPDLTAAFSLSAAQLGLLTSVYFLAFAAFQIPVGILLDRFGPRRTNASLLLAAASGALVFALSQGVPALLFGRALIGLGVSAGLMSSIKAFTLWYPLQRLPAMTGWALFCGGLGAMAATAPVEAALQLTDWRGVFLTMSVLTFAASAAIFWLVPERVSAGGHESLREQLQGVARVFGSTAFWRLAVASPLFQATNMALQGLWAGPWLADVAGRGRDEVAVSLLALAAATTAGFLFWGVTASWLARRGVTPLALFKFGTAVFLAVQLLLTFGMTAGAPALWVAFGLSGTSGSLTFSILSQSFPASMTGRANTALNLLVFLAAFACQWAFGAIVNLWPAEPGRYHPDGYSAAFATLLVLQLLGFGWLLIGVRVPAFTERSRVR
jgi:predicted MFS family arabinose efflux permease